MRDVHHSIVGGRASGRRLAVGFLSLLLLVSAARAGADRFVYPSPGSPVYADSAVAAGSLIEVETGSRISGSLRSNGNVDLKAGSTVTGNVSATGQILGTGTVTGTKTPGAPAIALPAPFDEATARGMADRIVEGNATYDADQVINDVLFVDGDIRFRASVNGTGTVIASGSIIFDNVTTGHPVVLAPSTRLSFSAFLDVTSIGKERPLRGVIVAGRDILGDKAVDITGVVIAGRTLRIHQDSKIAKLVLDSEAPRVTITSPANGIWVRTSTVRVEGTVTDNTGVAGVTVNGAAATLTGGSFARDVSLAEGTNPITVRAVDLAGNQGSAAVSVTLDTVAPRVTLNLPGGLVGTSPLSVSGSIVDSDPAVQVVVNGVPASPSAGVFQVSLLLEPGTNPVSAIATDRAGNQGTAAGSVSYDADPPAIVIETPVPDQVFNLEQARVAGTATDDHGAVSVKVNGVATPVTNGLFEAVVPLVEGQQSIVVRGEDSVGHVQEASVPVTRITLPVVVVTSPEDLATLASATVTVTGTINTPGLSVKVNGLDATVSGTTFTVQDVPLTEGGNLVTAVAATPDGRMGPDTIHVVRDLTAPHLSIDLPRAGSTVSTDTVTVGGLVNDIVPGTVNASEVAVTVNGRPAEVANRSFLVEGVPLALGDNTLTAVAVDESGNAGSVSIVVRRVEANARRVEAVSGGGQHGVIDTQLPQPLVAVVKDANGAPMPGQPVVFEVKGGNGTLDNGERELMVRSDAAGRAAVRFTLGSRAGIGNQSVEVSVAGFGEPAVFVVTALAGEPAHILVDAGDQQWGIAGQELPRPIVAAVTDAGHNRLAGVPVRFQVVLGEGRFPLGIGEMLMTTDSDGRAVLSWTLGDEEGIGNNVVVATLPDLPNGPLASFTASAYTAGPPGRTAIRGVVLDNQNQPVPGVTLRVLDTPLTTRTDAAGTFVVEGAPVGTVRLIVDGSTAERPGSWPDLEFVVTTISGREVEMNGPIFLLPLDLANGVPLDETRGGTITLPDLPGFSLEIAPGSVTFPGGSKSGFVSVTAVHSDKVPMVPNFGQQPRLIVTIQPAGARFDPPAKLTLPNVEGLEPGEVTELYSFDHDLGHFVSIGPGTVTADGALIVSNPGVGIVKAGWHCGGNPSSSGTTHRCEKCRKCEDNCCKPDPAQNNSSCNDKNKCTVNDKCDNGTCRGEAVKVTITKAPTVVCVESKPGVKESKPALATITPTNRSIVWKSQNPAVATVAGAGTSATVKGEKKGTVTIEAADSQTDCNKDSRSVWVIGPGDFDGITDKEFCANALSAGEYKVACVYGGALSSLITFWTNQTFSKSHPGCIGEGSAADATKHARWSCELYSSPKIRPIAPAITRFHENQPTDACISHEQDFNNNAVGRQNAADGKDCTQAALQDLAATLKDLAAGRPGRLQINNPPPPGVTCP
ncbi:MAG TPA: carboxypeptidase regulatory-like domain-containing protein [Thermoanaerobaculia bacterium]|nr:carboxypeptidase regulatory-like domain-containing protein [Thermoanaerobaculia bacterium]